MELGVRVFAAMALSDEPRVKIDEHADVFRATLLIARGAEDMVELGFEDHRHLRAWAAAIVDNLDRQYGAGPASTKRADREDVAEPAGAASLVYGKGDAR